MDERTVSCDFVGYAERYLGFEFYNPTIRSFFETGNARFFEDVEFGGEYNIRSVVFEEEQENNQDQVLKLDVVFILVLLLTMLKLFYLTLFKMLLWYKTTMKFFRHKTTLIKLFYSILFKIILPHKTIMTFFLKNL